MTSCQGPSFWMAAWPLALCGVFDPLLSLLFKWLTILYLYLLILITPPSCLGYTIFYGQVMYRVTTYLAFELHPLFVVMPLLILIYG